MGLRTAVLAAIFLAALSALPVVAQDRNYFCDRQGAIGVRVVSSSQIETFVEIPGHDEGAFDMVLDGGGSPSAGYIFSNGEYVMQFTGSGQDVLVYSAPDLGEVYCSWGDDPTGKPPLLFSSAGEESSVDEAAYLPTAGFSCGGKVRSQPSMDSRQVGSLSYGEAITILEYAGEMNDYSWFKIGFGSRTGYQWGGILSVAQGDLPGAFVGC